MSLERSDPAFAAEELAASITATDLALSLAWYRDVVGFESIAGSSPMECSAAQDIDQFAAAIRARGGILESEPTDTPWGVRMFRLRDPDGFRFTIASPPPRTVDP